MCQRSNAVASIEAKSWERSQMPVTNARHHTTSSRLPHSPRLRGLRPSPTATTCRPQKPAEMAQRVPLAVLLLLAWAAAASAFTWTPCDADKVPFTPDAVQLLPDPPAAGGQVTFKIAGTAVHDVPSGLISINVSFAGTQIYEEVDDLCSKTSCPIKTGPLDITYVQDLPPIAPPGEYDVQVVARDTQNTELMCVVVHFEMLPPSFVQKLLPGAWLRRGDGLPAAARRLLRRRA